MTNSTCRHIKKAGEYGKRGIHLLRIRIRPLFYGSISDGGFRQNALR